MDKIKMFEKNVREEYESFRRSIDKIFDATPVSETDGKFIQMALRTLLERDLFEESNTHPMLPGFGHAIAIGEDKHLIKKLLSNPQGIKIKKDKLRKDIILDLINSLNTEKPIILTSPEIKYDLMLNNDWAYFDNDFGEFVLKFKGMLVPIYDFSQEDIGKNILVLDKSAVNWKYKLFGKEKNKLDLIIKLDVSKDMYDVVARSIIKCEINPSKIKRININ